MIQYLLGSIEKSIDKMHTAIRELELTRVKVQTMPGQKEENFYSKMLRKFQLILI